MNGAPKQAENVISGSSRRPTSVPPTLDVYPEKVHSLFNFYCQFG